MLEGLQHQIRLPEEIVEHAIRLQRQGGLEALVVQESRYEILSPLRCQFL